MKALNSLLVLSFLTSIASAQQPSIYIDVGSIAQGFGVPTSDYAAAAPMGGVWNALDADAASGQQLFTTTPLMDINGAVTPVTASYDGLGTILAAFEFNGSTTSGNDEALLDDVGFGLGPSEFRFNGLPAGSYDVFTYAMAPDGGFLVTSVNVVNSPDGSQNVGGTFASGFVQGATHALHRVSVVAGQPLVIELATFAVNNSFNGVQIVPVDGGNSNLGTNYCGPAVQNASGASARLMGSGNPVAAANDFTLSCVDMPPAVFGLFIVSMQQDFVMNPGGSAGNLCLGGAIGRYIGPGQIQNSGAMGEISLLLDLTSVPQPNSFVSVQSGETWNFQAWFRDTSMGLATSNFSDGLEMTFL